MSQYFPKPFNSHFGDSIKVKIDLSNYATKRKILKIFLMLILQVLHYKQILAKLSLASLKTKFIN